MKPKPIETVVIRPVTLALPAPEDAAPAEPPLPPDWSAAQMREQVALTEMSKCPVRMRILLALASGGRVHVGGLAARTRIDQKTLSHHLTHLRTAGLVVCEQCGKCRWYTAAEGRVRCERQGADRVFLLIGARDGDVAVALIVGGAVMNGLTGCR